MFNEYAVGASMKDHRALTISFDRHSDLDALGIGAQEFDLHAASKLAENIHRGITDIDHGFYGSARHCRNLRCVTDTKLLLIDGHSQAFRSFYAVRADRFMTASGQYTNAVSGFLNTLLKLIGQYQPTHIAVAFDLPGGTFRTRRYPEYKGGRSATPEEFKGQIELIQQSLDVLGIRWFAVEDFEADDIVATLATRGQAEGMHVYVSSGDRDSFQLVTEDCTVLYPMPRADILVLDPEGIREKTGVSPAAYQDMAALVGEGADNLPGIPGVGPKTAAKWLNTYGDLETILANADSIKGKVGQSLRDHAEQARLNRELNQLVRDLPIVEDLDELCPIGVDREAMHELFDSLGFRNLRSRVLAELPMRDASFTEDASVAVEIFRGSLTDWLCSDVTYGVAVDSGVVAFGRADGSAWVGPLEDARVALADPEIRKVFHGVKDTRHAIVCDVAGVVGDTELEAYLLFPDQRVYDVDDLASRFTDVVMPSEVAEATLFDTNDDTVAARSVAVAALHNALTAQLAEHGNLEILDLELEVANKLFEMESVGIAVDESRLEELRTDFDGRVAAAAQAAYDAIGHEVNLSSPKQLQHVLFDELGLPTTKKTKSGYTTNADALADLAAKIAFREDDEALAGQQFLGALLQHRDAIKLRQSVEGLQRAVRQGRIHTTYQQTVAATGRLSSTDPNLQNIHGRTEEGLQIREAFVPGEGYVELMTADYSQIEMRLMAALSQDEELIRAFKEGADLHTYVASRVYGIPEEEVTSAQRSHIKAMSYGLAYGLSAYGLSQQLKISVGQAQDLMDDYFERFGRVRAYLDSLVTEASRDGYTETILGRRRYLPDLTSTNRMAREAAERAALNAPIQGSAADIIKIAMVNVMNAMAAEGLASRVLLQVHDELILEVAPGERNAVEAIVKREMSEAFQLSVPLSVGVGCGESWRAAAH